MADRPILFRSPMVRRLMRLAIDVSALYCAWAIQFACTGSYAAASITAVAVGLYGCWCFYDGYKSGDELFTTFIERVISERDALRMQLVACGVVALANTPESAANAREMHPDYRSASCDDVARAVDREMALRAERDALRVTLSRIADIAHNGGLVSSDWLNLFVPIRRLTLLHFDRSTTTEEATARVRAAIDAAMKGGGNG